MKKIINMVGTSLFENYLRINRDDNFESAYRFFKDNKIEADELDKETHRKENIRKVFKTNYFINNSEASAEIKSLIKLKEELNEPLEIYLLYSDTALSRISAEIIHDSLSFYDLFKDCLSKHPHKIEGLQTDDREKFNKGMINLIATIDNISQGYWVNMIINITAGYKATIPYLTILAQINKCPLFYIFEETDALIKIPYIPIEINWQLFEKYWEFFDKIANPNFISKRELPHDFLSDCSNLLEEIKIDNVNYVALGPVGEMLWRKYKSKFFIFYAPEEVYEKIQGQSQVKRILINKFYKSDERQNKTEIKNEHYVYDDGNNPYRIFYFEKEEKIYIYKTFDKHSEYEDYLRKVKIDENFKEQIRNQSKVYKWEVQNV